MKNFFYWLCLLAKLAFAGMDKIAQTLLQNLIMVN